MSVSRRRNLGRSVLRRFRQLPPAACPMKFASSTARTAFLIRGRAENFVCLLLAVSLALVAMPSLVLAQEQTTLELPLPTGQTQAQSQDKHWTVTFDSNVSYFSTKTTAAGLPTVHSNVTYVPMGFGFVGNPNDDWKIEFGIRSGYQNISTRNGSNSPLPGVANTNYSGWVDTTVSNTITYLGFNGFQPFFSMNINAPTGNSFVPGAAGANASDPDVTQIAGFGTGWNYGPTLGVNIPLKSDLILTLSAGYTARERFVRVGSTPGGPPQPGFGTIQDINPGDDLTLTSSLGYQSGAWSLQATATYTLESTTRVDGANFFKQGDSYQLSAAAGYAWNDAWSSKISTTFTHTSLNSFPTTTVGPVHGDFTLVLEQFDTNSNVTNVSFDTTYKVGRLSLGPSVTFLFRDHNGYTINSDQFVPAKTLWMAGGAFEYALNDRFSINGRVQHVWAAVDLQDMAPLVPPMETTGWIYSIGGKAQF